MSEDHNGGDSARVIELTERQRERLDKLKAECKAADPNLPEPTDQQMVKSLLDTWDAVNQGLYSGGDADD